jgi:hypothetical protein
METSTIPLTVTPEAEAFLDQLGMRPQFEQMVAHLRQAVPEVYEITAHVEPPYDLGGGDIILIQAFRRPSGLEDDPTNRELSRWRVATFPPEVLMNLVILTCEVE